MTGKTKYILIVLLAVTFADVSGQNSQTMYFMNLPQNHFMNPALRPSNSIYIGLPALSGINLNINNNFVNFSDVILKGQPEDSVISFLNPRFNVDKFISKINDRNSFEPEAMIQILGLGFSVGDDNYVFFDINDRFDGNIVLPGDLFRLVLKGGEGLVGSKMDLSALKGDVKYYREFGAGISRNITDRLRIGIKVKLLFGIADVTIDTRSLGVAVNSDNSYTLNTNLTVDMSLPLNVYTDSNHNLDSLSFDNDRFKTSSGIRNFVSGSKNVGTGMDLGATYQVNDRIVVSASVTDLGFIRWKKDITSLKADNRIKFSGLNISDVVNKTITIDELGQDMLDSLKNAFVVSNTKAPFTTYLPFGISFGGSYSVTSKFSVGLLSYSRVIGKQIREALTLSANINLGSALSASLSYTAENHKYDNLGAGLAFRAGVTQFYLVSDRIPVVWNRIKNDKSNIVLPANWNTFNLRLGMNLVFGNGVKEKNDKPMILVE